MFLATTAGAGSSSSMIIILLLFFVLMWFFMIRPEKKKKKKIEEMRSALTVGDQIVTIGGVMGTIVHVTEDDITIETGEDRVRVQFKNGQSAATSEPRLLKQRKKKRSNKRS